MSSEHSLIWEGALEFNFDPSVSVSVADTPTERVLLRQVS